MIRGLYTAAAGMLASTMATDTLANNIANINTVGFKNDRVQFQNFREMLITRMSDQGSDTIGGIATGSKIRDNYVDFRGGTMRQTGGTFDVAIEGDGFLTVKRPDGELLYTRAGNMTVNDAGYLVTLNGDRVQGELGDIVIALDQGPFNISPRGEIRAKQARVIDQLKIARFEDNRTLAKLGESLFVPTAATEEVKVDPNAPVDYKIMQGYLEQSNVNPVSEMVNNIQGMRLYEALQKNIHISNQTLDKAVNDVGRTR